MKLFFGTSSLIKLYHKESGTEELGQIFSIATITSIYLSELSKIEFASAIWKKVRTNEILESTAVKSLQMFESDFDKFTFKVVDSEIVEHARSLILKYGTKGLRTLDSIQLSTALSLAQKVDVNFTADSNLNIFFKIEGLNVDLPNN